MLKWPLIQFIKPKPVRPAPPPPPAEPQRKAKGYLHVGKIITPIAIYTNTRT